MKEKDITQKALEGFNEVFADIINVLLFDGKTVVKPENLTEADPHSYYKASGEVRSQDRDVSKYWGEEKVRFALYGIENQTDVYEMMPIRVISYDGAAYRKELAEKRDDFYPVITLVLYFGYENKWNKGKSLLKVLDVPEELKDYVSDYEMNLFEIAYLDDETVSKFTSDFKVLADYAVQMRKTGKYVPAADVVMHPTELFEAINALTGDRSFEDNYITYIEKHPEHKEGGVQMRQYLEELKAEARAEGEANARQYLEELKAEERAEARAECMEKTVNTIKEYIERGILHLDVSEEELYSDIRRGRKPETV